LREPKWCDEYDFLSSDRNAISCSASSPGISRSRASSLSRLSNVATLSVRETLVDESFESF